jgi:hypothetical protein
MKSATSGCTVNIGNAMNPKSGEFRVPEAGLYLFLITCCTFDMKKCLLSIRKNGKDVANIFDQDGMENRVRFVCCENAQPAVTLTTEIWITAFACQYCVKSVKEKFHFSICKVKINFKNLDYIFSHMYYLKRTVPQVSMRSKYLK